MSNRDNYPQIVRTSLGWYRVIWDEAGEVVDEYPTEEQAREHIADCISAEFDNGCQ